MLNKVLTSIRNNFSISWLVYFFVAVVAFNFINNFIVFVVFSVICNASFLFITKKKIDTDTLLTLLISLIPLLSVGIFAMTSKSNLDPNLGISKVKYVFLLVSMLSVPFLGYQSRNEKKFNIKIAIKVIYVVLGLWMLINFIITLVQFGPFYTFLYSKKFFFDYGHISIMSIDTIAYVIWGFEVKIVSIELFALLASILSSAILGVFFVSFKEDKRSFLLYLICGCIGLLCLILTINKTYILCYFALFLGFSLTVLFAKGILKFNKVTKIVIYSICGFLGILLLIFILNALKVQPLTGFIEEHYYLNKFFRTNRVVNRYFLVLRAFAEGKYTRGFTPYLIGEDSMRLSGSWLFDMIAIAQLFGWFFFIVFIAVLFVRYVQYVKSSSDELSSKVLVLGLILGILLFSFFRYNSTPFYDEETYLPIFFMAPFILLTFIYGYMGNVKEEVAA